MTYISLHLLECRFPGLPQNYYPILGAGAQKSTDFKSHGGWRTASPLLGASTASEGCHSAQTLSKLTRVGPRQGLSMDGKVS